MSRRTRAVAFLIAALACAALAATVAARYRSSAQARYGTLQPVLVATADLPPGEVIVPAQASHSLAVRRVPASFVPPGALRRPQDALGQAPSAAIPAGAYVLGAQLAVPSAGPPPVPATARGLRPVQVGVGGAEALVIGGADPAGSRVDVVVAQQSGLGNKARTFVAASAVELLALRAPQGSGEGWSATLAVSREQALALIAAEAGGREIRLLPRP